MSGFTDELIERTFVIQYEHSDETTTILGLPHPPDDCSANFGPINARQSTAREQILSRQLTCS